MKISRYWLILPICGSILYLLLYLLAAYNYPGGSQSDPYSVGFSWSDNYWCNLLNYFAINGQINEGQPFAITGMLVLGISMTIFFLIYPKFTNLPVLAIRIIQFSGVLSIITGTLLITNLNHDLITNLASAFGGIALLGILFSLKKMRLAGLFYFGMVIILLIGLNNLFYYSPTLIQYLPILQKITFLAFLIWICSISIAIYTRRIQLPKTSL